MIINVSCHRWLIIALRTLKPHPRCGRPKHFMVLARLYLTTSAEPRGQEAFCFLGSLQRNPAVLMPIANTAEAWRGPMNGIAYTALLHSMHPNLYAYANLFHLNAALFDGAGRRRWSLPSPRVSHSLQHLRAPPRAGHLEAEVVDARVLEV